MTYSPKQKSVLKYQDRKKATVGQKIKYGNTIICEPTVTEISGVVFDE